MQFVECLSREDINMSESASFTWVYQPRRTDYDVAAELKKLAWSGVPPHLRPIVWPLLLGYIPLPSSARLQVLQRKREEFKNLVKYVLPPAVHSCTSSCGFGFPVASLICYG